MPWKFRYISLVARCNYHKVIPGIRALCTANFKLSQPSYLSPFSRHTALSWLSKDYLCKVAFQSSKIMLGITSKLSEPRRPIQHEVP